jgi:hypothetical protein
MSDMHFVISPVIATREDCVLSRQDVTDIESWLNNKQFAPGERPGVLHAFFYEGLPAIVRHPFRSLAVATVLAAAVHFPPMGAIQTANDKLNKAELAQSNLENFAAKNNIPFKAQSPLQVPTNGPLTRDDARAAREFFIYAITGITPDKLVAPAPVRNAPRATRERICCDR